MSSARKSQALNPGRSFIPIRLNACGRHHALQQLDLESGSIRYTGEVISIGSAEQMTVHDMLIDNREDTEGTGHKIYQ